jgi:hypothetical protein
VRQRVAVEVAVDDDVVVTERTPGVGERLRDGARTRCFEVG